MGTPGRISVECIEQGRIDFWVLYFSPTKPTVLRLILFALVVDRDIVCCVKRCTRNAGNLACSRMGYNAHRFFSWFSRVGIQRI